jgi:hypothetical protein
MLDTPFVFFPLFFLVRINMWSLMAWYFVTSRRLKSKGAVHPAIARRARHPPSPLFSLSVSSPRQIQISQWPFPSSGASSPPRRCFQILAYHDRPATPSPCRKPISLISHSDVRYRGILAGIDPAASTIQLSNGTNSIYSLKGFTDAPRNL